MSLSTPRTIVFLSVFYFILLLFALSDLKRFIFHVHISRVDRVPVQVDIDSSSSLWYPIFIGIVFNILIVFCSLLNLYCFLWQEVASDRFWFSTLILLILFTIRFLINIVVTRNRNGRATPTLVERSFFAPSLSLGEELATISLDWIIKCAAFVGTFYFCYFYKQQRTMSIERRRETQLMSNSE